MLTKQDLNHIRGIIKEEVYDGIRPLDKRLDGVDKRLANVEKDVKTVKKDIVQIRMDQRLIINFFDREYLGLRSRVERIEELLKIVPNI